MCNTDDSKKKLEVEYKKIKNNINVNEVIENEDPEELKNGVEECVKKYVCGIVDNSLSKTLKTSLVMKIVDKIAKLDKHDIFVKERLGALKSLNCYNKQLHLYQADSEVLVSAIQNILKDFVKKYKKNGQLISFMFVFKKNYYYNMRTAIFSFLDIENKDYKIQVQYAKDDIKKLANSLFKNDKVFLKKFKKKLSDKETFSYNTIKYFLIENILDYIDLTLKDDGNEQNKKLYSYINKEEYQKNTPEKEIEYVISEKTKQDFIEIKKQLNNILDKLYSVDNETDNKENIDKNLKHFSKLSKKLNNIQIIDINKLKEVEVKISDIERCLFKVSKIFKEKVVIGIVQVDKDGKEYNVLEREKLRKPRFIDAKEKFFSYMEIYNNIKDKFTKSSQRFFECIFKYIILEYRRRGHEDIELYDYVKNDEKFIKYYEKNVPKNENPNYIKNITDKKDASSEEKIVHKAITFVVDYLGIKFDTGRKKKSVVVKKIQKTIKEENTVLRYLNRVTKEDF